MSESSRRPFKELLAELIALYRQIKQEDGLNHPDIEINGDVDFLLSHFDAIRDNMDDETIENMGEPVRDLLENLLAELRREMKNPPEQNQQKEPREATQAEESKPSSISELEKIDKKLQQKDLPTEEINKLLDQRSKLVE